MNNFLTYRSDRMKPSCGRWASGGRAAGLHEKVRRLCVCSKSLRHTNDTRAEVPVVADDLDELLIGLLTGAVGVDEDRQRLSDTNGVRELDKAAAGEAGVNQGLGDPTRSVSGRAIDLGEVLAREGTSTVSTPTTVRVDDDLTARQTSVTLGSANDEAP